MNPGDNIDFFQKYNNFMMKDDTSSENKDSQPLQELDIGLEFKQFLEKKTKKAHADPNVQCENH